MNTNDQETGNDWETTGNELGIVPGGAGLPEGILDWQAG
jgi:hypothetical protein